MKTAHEDLHSEQGAQAGDRRDRASNPVIKVEDLAWLEFEKPDLDAAERFAHDFGFATAHRDDVELHLRGAFGGSQSVIIRKGRRSRFTAPVFRASSRADLERLARANSATVAERRGPGGGAVVDLRDPTGVPVRVVADAEQLPELPERHPLTFNFGGGGAGQRHRNGRRGRRRRSSGSATSCWRRRRSPGRWTGTWRTSG